MNAKIISALFNFANALALFAEKTNALPLALPLALASEKNECAPGPPPPLEHR